MRRSSSFAALLGTVADDELAAEMIAESEPAADDVVVDEVPAVAHIRVEDRGSTAIAELTLDEGAVIAAIDGAGMLRDISAHPALTEEGRYQLRVARIVATLHDTSGSSYRVHRWSCDGYGRIIGTTVEEL